MKLSKDLINEITARAAGHDNYIFVDEVLDFATDGIAEAEKKHSKKLLRFIEITMKFMPQQSDVLDGLIDYFDIGVEWCGNCQGYVKEFIDNCPGCLNKFDSQVNNEFLNTEFERNK